MDLLSFFSHKMHWADAAGVAEFASLWKTSLVKKGAVLARQGEPDHNEYILLDGRMISQIYDPTGAAICVGFFKGPCVITPNIARAKAERSLVAIEATSDALVAQLDSHRLTELMIASEPVRDWANGVLQDELAHKADREWSLAALSGAERLAWFRQNFSGYEEFFVHSQIASFLGMTPVTLSRLRRQLS